MAKVYRDINGVELNDGDEILTIRLNGKAVGGDLVKAYFRKDEKGNGFIASRLDSTYEFHFYKRNFEDKVYKL